MDGIKRQRLEAAGWCVGTAEDFLGLDAAEAEMVEIRLALTRGVKDFRSKQNLSQKDLAKKMRSSQSRIAKIEAGDPSVSLDLILRALLSTGATRDDVAGMIAYCQTVIRNE